MGGVVCSLLDAWTFPPPRFFCDRPGFDHSHRQKSINRMAPGTKKLRMPPEYGYPGTDLWYICQRTTPP